MGWPVEDLGKLSGAVEQSGRSVGEFQSALHRPADPEAADLIASTLTRLIEDVQAGHAGVSTELQPLLEAYYPSQLCQAITDGPILMGLLAVIWLRPRKPGVVGSWFLIGYGVLRIATELVRQPDEGVAVLATPLGDLTRGQLLSIVMVIAGIVALVICARRTVAPMGGLMGRHEGTEARRHEGEAKGD